MTDSEKKALIELCKSYVFIDDAFDAMEAGTITQDDVDDIIEHGERPVARALIATGIAAEYDAPLDVEVWLNDGVANDMLGTASRENLEQFWAKIEPWLQENIEERPN